jgi:hypothetical protein
MFVTLLHLLQKMVCPMTICMHLRKYIHKLYKNKDLATRMQDRT